MDLTPFVGDMTALVAPRIRLIGGVSIDGQSPLRDQQRRLFATLALNIGQPVAGSRLRTELSKGSIETSIIGRGTLWTYVMYLREIPGVHIETLGHAYMLAGQPADVDMLLLPRLIACALAEMRYGCARRAQRQLHMARLLLGGLAFDGLTGGSELTLWAARLPVYQRAIDLYAFDAALRLGQHHEVRADLLDRWQTDPSQEDLAALLVLALFRCGQEDFAKRVYQTVRQKLAEDYGLDPSPQLQRLSERLRLGDTALLDPSLGVDTL